MMTGLKFLHETVRLPFRLNGRATIMIEETSNTWLNSLKQGDPQATGWHHLVESYGPFIRRILVRKGLRGDTADDVVQNVMTVVVQRLPDFERQRTGSFRSWLRGITINCLKEYWKSKKHQMQAEHHEDLQELIQVVEDPHSGFTESWNREHAQHVLDRLLEKVAEEFAPQSIEIFRRLSLNVEAVDDVARGLGLTANACFITRSRVLKRLRELVRLLFGEDEGLLELM
jgi:RNA polymerase sigma-70 factor (ECF subfamily)